MATSTSRGASTGGTDAFGDPLECSLLTSYGDNSTLAHDSHGRPQWSQSPGLAIFYLATDPRGFPALISPPSFAVPYGFSRQKVEDALPFYAPPDSHFPYTHSSKALRAGFEEVGVDWNELQAGCTR
jgi:hypothetical protein